MIHDLEGRPLTMYRRKFTLYLLELVYDQGSVKGRLTDIFRSTHEHFVC